ncbi:MAG: hypothetical protein M3N16_05310 [Actinomycetota bacterium]|nr:hypothetical protein [Actinomycetota bacterium]
MGESPGRARRWTAVAIGVSLYLLASYLTLLLGPEAFAAAIEEDGPIETLGAVALLAAAVLFLVAFLRAGRPEHRSRRRPVRRLSLLVLAAIFLFGAGEEYSWGQRLFGVETPAEIENVNRQGELNFHNLNVFTGWLDMTFLFQLFWIAFAVVVPVAAAISPRARQRLVRLLPVIPLGLALMFVANHLLAEVAYLAVSGRFEGEYPLDHSVFEIKETNLSVLFAVVAGWAASRPLGAPTAPRDTRTESDVFGAADKTPTEPDPAHSASASSR